MISDYSQRSSNSQVFAFHKSNTLSRAHEIGGSNLPYPTNYLNTERSFILSGTGRKSWKTSAPFSWRLAFIVLVIYESSGLKIKHYPYGSMVAGIYLATHPSVYTTIHESVRHFR